MLKQLGKTLQCILNKYLYLVFVNVREKSINDIDFHIFVLCFWDFF